MKLSEVVHELDHIQRGTVDDPEVVVKVKGQHHVLKNVLVRTSGTVVFETTEYTQPVKRPSDE